jgi:hypothetical protein
MVLNQSHLAIKDILHGCPGMIPLLVPQTVSTPRGSGIVNKILFHKQHSIPFLRVNDSIKLEYAFDPDGKYCKVILLVGAIIGLQNHKRLRRYIDKSRLFGCCRLSESDQ